MKNYYISDQSVIFNLIKAKSPKDVLNSNLFKDIIERFYQLCKNKYQHDAIISQYSTCDLIKVYNKIITNRHQLIDNHKELYFFSQELYDYWRKFYRFAALRSIRNSTDLVNITNNLNAMILILYRRITQRLSNKKHTVYRQLPAGVNATVGVCKNSWTIKGYEHLKNILFIKGILIRPPFIVRSKSNIRKDFFSETSNNFLTSLRLDTKKFYAFPIKVGKSLAYVYFHIDYFYQAVSLANLFESAYKKEFLNKKPEIILIYGTNSSIDGKIYHDKINDIYIGIVNNQTKNDYFGYLKKILLTLYNLRSIDHNILPIHGAMVQITLKNHGVKNVVLVGDSGAGKSETLEALKRVGQDNIKNIEVIFDDMGSFSVHHKRVYASGTEIGAFVRLDDLEADYAYREIDRAIMVNPEKKNSRVIIPIAEYDLITALHPIDFVLYANNYETNIKTNVRLFNDLDKIKKIFIEGKRMAKGTTSESGMSKSFFANPFGPMQRIKQSTKMIDNYFIMLKHNGVAIGEIYTRLAIPSYEQDGPNMAATSLLKLLLRN